MAFFSLKLLLICICFFKFKYVLMYCGGTKGDSGTITSPNYPNKYPGDKYCFTTIRAPAGYRIRLKWDYFNIPGKMPSCTNSFVRITRCTSPLKYLIRYCGTDFKPHDIYSYGNCIKVDFRGASKPQMGYGFKLYYKTFANSVRMIKPTSCSQVSVRENSAIVKSPNYPLSYSSSDSCKWKFNLLKNQRIKILFMDIDLYTPRKYDSYCYQPANDVIILKGFQYGTSYTYSFCGKQTPFARSFYYKQFDYFEIIFNPHKAYHNHRGFLLGFVIFNKKDIIVENTVITKNKVNSQFRFPISGIIAIVAFTIFFIVCFTIFKKRVARRNNNQLLAALDNTNANCNQNTDASAPYNYTIVANGSSAMPVPCDLPPSYQECLSNDQPYPYATPATTADTQPYPYSGPIPTAGIQPYPYSVPMPTADAQPYPYVAPPNPATSYPPPPAYNSVVYQTAAPSAPMQIS